MRGLENKYIFGNEALPFDFGRSNVQKTLRGRDRFDLLPECFLSQMALIEVLSSLIC